MNNEIERTYTVEDIAKMTNLTDRTIRNYLKRGLLKGRKIVGQWRFSLQEIKEFFDNSDVRKDMLSEYKQDILDFVDNVNTFISGERQSCVIADLYVDQEKASTINNKLCDFTSTDAINNMRLYFEYSDEYQRARFTIFAAPEISAKLLSIINEN